MVHNVLLLSFCPLLASAKPHFSDAKKRPETLSEPLAKYFPLGQIRYFAWNMMWKSALFGLHA
jgi:hypothetical protein